MTSDSIAFDRIVDDYDATRGGTERRGRVAAGIAPWLRPGFVVEVGVGTGAVARPLTERGHPVVGVDLSLRMLRQARDRLGSRVAVGDGYALPLRPGSVPNVVTVWVTQLVPDVAGFVAALGALLSPGGRLAIVPSSHGGGADDEIADVVGPMSDALRPRRDGPDQLVAARARRRAPPRPHDHVGRRRHLAHLAGRAGRSDRGPYVVDPLGPARRDVAAPRRAYDRRPPGAARP